MDEQSGAAAPREAAAGADVDATRDSLEARLRDSEARLELAMRAGGLGTWEYEVATGENRWGPGMAELLGLSAAEAATRDRDWLDFLHPDDVPRMQAVLRATLERGAPFFLECRIRRADGRYVWIADWADVVRDAAGRPIRLVGVAQDVTGRKTDAAARRALEARFRTAVEAASEILWTNDPDGRMRGPQPGWAAFTGQTFEEYQGYGWASAVHPDDAEPTVRAWQRAVASGSRFVFEHRVRRHDGAWRTFAIRALPVRDEDGTDREWVGVHNDITDLRATERQLREVIDSMFAFVGVLAPDGTLIEANRAPVEAAGLAREDVIGRAFWDCGWWSWSEQVQQRLRAAFDRACGGEVVRYDETIRVADDGRMIIDFMLQPVFEGERLKFVIPSAVDVTARRASESQLIEADRRKDEFLATLSHELRNPLAPIRTAAQVLGSEGLAPAQLAWARQVLERQVQHMALLLDDLLDLARVTQGKLDLRRRRVGLATIVESAVEAARPLLERKHHRLRVQLPDPPPELDADPLRLAQVLSNLLTNAAKYTDAGGRVELRARCEGEALVVEVEDDGIGIAPEAIPRLFTMFSQLHGPGGRAEGGLGVGLALVRGLVELHGGTVTASSHGPGAGSTFTVRVPLPPGQPAGAPAATTPAPAAHALRRRVLLADDNRDAVDMLALLLGVDGHEVRVAYDGRAALALARAFRPELALLDIGMPGLDGYGVARALRAEDWAGELRLVAVTGWGQDEDKRRAAEAGFDAHLTKPVEPSALDALLRGPLPAR